MARNWREVWRWMIPRWLGVPDDPTDEGARVAHTVTLIMDATLQRAREGLDARFPSRTGESANQLAAADRGLLRGRSEPLADFATRLKAWRYPRTHKVRGGAHELLAQVNAYWGGIKATTIDLTDRQYTIYADSSVQKGTTIGGWDWDSAEVYVVPTSGAASDVLGDGTLTPAIPACKVGALLLAHAFVEGGTIATPDGWTLVATHSPSGVNGQYLWARLSPNTGGGTVSLLRVNAGGRAIARVNQVPGEWEETIADNFEGDAYVHSGSGTSVTESTLDACMWAVNALAFVGYDSGGTVNAFTGGDMTWTEVAAEAVAGSAGGGVGIQAQYAHAEAGDEAGAGTCTLGNTASWGVIAVRLNRQWARFWLTLTPADADAVDSWGFGESPAYGDPLLWGGAVGTPGYLLGMVGVTPADILAMRNLFQQLAWHPEHARPEWLIIALDPAANTPIPDGTWERWSSNVGGTQTATRDVSVYRYVSLSPSENNTYAGNPDSFAEDTEMPGGGTYGGDATNAAAWGAVTLPSGAAYTGDPTNFPAAVLLVDDGSAP
jgi:hypothetical protein